MKPYKYLKNTLKVDSLGAWSISRKLIRYWDKKSWGKVTKIFSRDENFPPNFCTDDFSRQPVYPHFWQLLLLLAIYFVEFPNFHL